MPCACTVVVLDSLKKLYVSLQSGACTLLPHRLPFSTPCFNSHFNSLPMCDSIHSLLLASRVSLISLAFQIAFSLRMIVSTLVLASCGVLLLSYFSCSLAELSFEFWRYSKAYCPLAFFSLFLSLPFPFVHPPALSQSRYEGVFIRC